MSTRRKKERRLTSPAPTQTNPEISFLAAYRSGPLPPAEEMAKYESIYPGATKLLFEKFIEQTNHRMKLEKTVIEGDNRRANIGQIISAILSFLGIGMGSFLAYVGKDLVGFSLIVSSIGTLLAAFYGGAILRKIERSQKG